MPNDPYSYAARYSEIVRSEQVAAIPNTLFRYQGDLGLSPQECWLLCILLSYRWTAENPYPSLRTISAQTGVSRPSIQSYLASLKVKGFVTAIEQIDETGRQTSSAYELDGLFARLEQVVRLKVRPAGMTGLRPKFPEGGQPGDHAGQPAIPKQDAVKEDPPEEEPELPSPLLRMLALRITGALKRPALRDDVAQKLATFAVDPLRLEKAVSSTLGAWSLTDGEAELWRILSQRLAS